MAISSLSSSTISASFSPSRSELSQFFHFSRLFQFNSRSNWSFPRLIISSSSSNQSGSNASDSNQSDSKGSKIPDYECVHQVWQPRRRKGAAVYVTIPIDSVNYSGLVTNRNVLRFSFLSLASAGVEGITMEIWWGLVEQEERRYNWTGYLDIINLAREYGLKVRVVLAFHSFGAEKDKFWIPLPYWVRKEMIRQPELAYSDRFGRKSNEYISLGCDTLPVLNGRSPIQAYSDFMRSFRDLFVNFLGVTITGVRVGMGPAGELRYPSLPSKRLACSWRVREVGEFQCFDKYMIASLRASAQEIGLPKWGITSLLDAVGGPFPWKMINNPEQTQFFKSDGSWNTPYGRFFLKWYSGMLLQHGEKLCMVAEALFWGMGVSVSAKVAGIPWHYDTESHASELSAGYYNTSIRDGYLPIARMFARHGVTLCCSGFDMRDTEDKLLNPFSSPEGLLRHILLAARAFNLPLEGENFVTGHYDESLKQVLKVFKFYSDGLDEVMKMFKFYSDGLDEPIFSFNYVRMSPNFFEPHCWPRFSQFVKKMSHGEFEAKLD